METPELRTDVLTGRQMILAAGRNDRPRLTAAPFSNGFEGYDPFLEGHENDTPNESIALRRTDSQPNEPGWLLRVVPNRYPAVNESPVSAGLTAATGIHDVVIECPDQRSRLTQLSVTEVTRILVAWQRRIRDLSAIAGVQSISVFRNQGNGAGASLPHSHSQIVATVFISQQVQQRVDLAATFDATKPHALFQHWLQSELDAECRVVDAGPSFAIICPFASRVDGHVRFVPLDATPTNFAQLSEEQLVSLARSLHATVLACENTNGPVDQNLNLILPPTNKADVYPWMLEFLPRRNRFAGFEMMTDIDIVTTRPEDTAAKLRKAAVSCHSGQDDITPPGFAWR